MAFDGQKWRPRVLEEYVIGRAMASIGDIDLRYKAIAQVGALIAEKTDIVHDLQGCLDLAGNPARVQLWIRDYTGSPGRLRFGFYGYPWALRAIDFLAKNKLRQADHDWISGLVFGYRPEKIQEFLDRQKKKGQL